MRDITTPISTLRARGSGLTSIYIDLGDGTIYGSRNFTNADEDQTVTIDLNSALVSALNASSGQAFALGGRISTLDSIDNTERIFLSSGDAPSSDAQLLLTYGSPITLAIAATDANKNEGNSGNTPFTFTVTRSGSTTDTNSVSWAVTGCSTNPANGADFGGTFSSGTLSFAANETSKVITINVSGDTTVEPDETFNVTLSNPTNGATITTATATGTILNNDGPRQIIIPDFDGTTPGDQTTKGFRPNNPVGFNVIPL